VLVLAMAIFLNSCASSEGQFGETGSNAQPVPGERHRRTGRVAVRWSRGRGKSWMVTGGPILSLRNLADGFSLARFVPDSA